jgi:RsmE family RNA methyltransferase
MINCTGKTIFFQFVASKKYVLRSNYIQKSMEILQYKRRRVVMNLVRQAVLAVMVMIRGNVAWISPYQHVFCGRPKVHSSVVCRLNRFLFDESEMRYDDSKVAKVVLPIDDYRTVHAAKILSLRNGDKLRCGVVSNTEHDGLVTDEATIQWLPEGKVRKSEPLGNGLPPGSLEVSLIKLQPPDTQVTKPCVSLMLALPRPIALGRMLPMISQMGIDTLILTEAQKVPKDYFGSHLFRKPHLIKERLIEGLCQSGDVKLPNIIVTRNLSNFLSNELDNFFPADKYARVIAHPRRNASAAAVKLKDVPFPSASQRRILVAVGPEGGWEEPEELDRFVNDHGFVQVSMGMRVLRSDCAVISLLALAHDACS